MPGPGEAYACTCFFGLSTLAPSEVFSRNVTDILGLQVKQMVEIFIKQSEIMPSDESIDQHQKKRAEEIADVDKDKVSAEGLFKGTFPPPRAELQYDEEDGVLRCPGCGHEHEGGPNCLHCGQEVDDAMDAFPFSDIDEDDDIDDEELEIDLNIEAQARHAGRRRGVYNAYFGLPGPHHLPQRIQYSHYHFRGQEDDEDNSEVSGPSHVVIDSDDEEDAGSLEDFIENDEGPAPRPTRNREPINLVSEDESDSDEGGAINNRHTRRIGRRYGNRSDSEVPSILTVTDDSVDGSENDSHNEETLRQNGWSPLQHGDESDASDLESPELHRRGQYATTEDDESDTETIGNMPSDVEDSIRLRELLSETPTPSEQARGYREYSREGTPYDYTSGEGEGFDYGSDGGDGVSHTDGDGDTEMSVSPNRSRSSRSVSTDNDYGRHGGRGFENLGVANEIHELDESSDEGSIRAPIPRRRQPRLLQLNQHGQPAEPRINTDPRISMMFAQHQQTMRGSEDLATAFDGWMAGPRLVSTHDSSRSRRRSTYRQVPPARRTGPMRSSSATRVYTNSRPSRPAAFYSRDLPRRA